MPPTGTPRDAPQARAIYASLQCTVFGPGGVIVRSSNALTSPGSPGEGECAGSAPSPAPTELTQATRAQLYASGPVEAGGGGGGGVVMLVGERPNTAAPQGKAGSRVLKQCLSSALSAQQRSSCLCRSLRFHTVPTALCFLCRVR